MKKFNIKNNGISILGVLLTVALLFLVLSYFHISIRSIVESPSGQDNINYVEGTGINLWDKYLAVPVNHLWYDIFLPDIWEPLKADIQRINTSASSPSTQ